MWAPFLEDWIPDDVKHKSKNNAITLTSQEREIVKRLNHPVYTIEFLSEWVNRNDNVSVNAPSALQAMGAKGYYQAVQQICKLNK